MSDCHHRLPGSRFNITIFPLIFGLWLLILSAGGQLAAQELPRCIERSTSVRLPRVEGHLWCLERPIDAHEAGELAFTAIEFGQGGVLYAVRPLTGELFAFTDSDADGLPDEPILVADGMRFPHGLAYDAGTLYIIGDGVVYRFADETLDTLVDDLPGGRGFMASGIAVDAEALYVALPMPCDFCEPEDDLHGTVIRLTHDGDERRVIARGLRYPAGLALYDGALWVTDTGRDDLRDTPFLDEINRIDLNDTQIPHFGFPYCIGADNHPDFAADFDCASATKPYFSLQTHSTPVALMPYHSTTFRIMRETMVMVLGGSMDNSDIRGYQFAYIQEKPDETIIESIFPFDKAITFIDRVAYDPAGYVSKAVPVLNMRGAGFWPHRAFDVTESPEGWMYMSVGGGSIYVLRPGDDDPCDFRPCD